MPDTRTSPFGITFSVGEKIRVANSEMGACKVDDVREICYFGEGDTVYCRYINSEGIEGGEFWIPITHIEKIVDSVEVNGITWRVGKMCSMGKIEMFRMNAETPKVFVKDAGWLEFNEITKLNIYPEGDERNEISIPVADLVMKYDKFKEYNVTELKLLVQAREKMHQCSENVEVQKMMDRWLAECPKDKLKALIEVIAP